MIILYSKLIHSCAIVPPSLARQAKYLQALQQNVLFWNKSVAPPATIQVPIKQAGVASFRRQGDLRNITRE